MTATVWTSREDQLVLALAERGMPATRIARELSSGGFVVSDEVVRRRLRRLRWLAEREPKVIEIDPGRQRRAEVQGYSKGPLRLFDQWPQRACRWPIYAGAITARDPIFCGDPAADGSRYCEAHRARAFVPRKAADPGQPSRFRLAPLVSARKA